MRRKIIVALLLLLAGLQTPAQAATPADSVALDGLTAEAPPGAAWSRVESTSRQVVLERSVEGQRTTLTLSTPSMDPLPEDEAFLRFAEDRQAKALSALEKVSVHYTWTHKKGAPCVAYDGIFKDQAAHVSPFLTFRGQLCRHPDAAGRMIQMELAQRSNTQEAAYQIDLLELAEQVFDAVQFTQLDKESRSGR